MVGPFATHFVVISFMSHFKSFLANPTFGTAFGFWARHDSYTLRDGDYAGCVLVQKVSGTVQGLIENIYLPIIGI